MAWESSDVVTFNLWLLLQGQAMVHWLWWVVFPVDTNLLVLRGIGLFENWNSVFLNLWISCSLILIFLRFCPQHPFGTVLDAYLKCNDIGRFSQYLYILSLEKLQFKIYVLQQKNIFILPEQEYTLKTWADRKCNFKVYVVAIISFTP